MNPAVGTIALYNEFQYAVINGAGQLMTGTAVTVQEFLTPENGSGMQVPGPSLTTTNGLFPDQIGASSPDPNVPIPSSGTQSATTIQNFTANGIPLITQVIQYWVVSNGQLVQAEPLVVDNGSQGVQLNPNNPSHSR